MNRGQKFIGNLTPQEAILLVAAGILFALVLIWILISRLSARDPGRQSWFEEIVAGGLLRGTVTPAPSFSSAPQPVRVIPSDYEVNCTYPSDYWSLQTAAWAIENIVVGRSSFSKDRIEAFLKDERGDPASELYKQFFTAALNTMKGADSTDITGVLERARRWLESPELENLTDREQLLEVLIMAEALKGYNTGVIGPGRCEFEEIVLLATPTLAVLPPAPSGLSETASQEGLPAATSTPVPTQVFSSPTSPPPSLTPLRSATPTRTPSAQPTATSLPTQAELSTPVLDPSPTSGGLPTLGASPSPDAPTPGSPPTSAPTPTLHLSPSASPTLPALPSPTIAPTATSEPTSTPEPSPTPSFTPTFTPPPPSATPTTALPTPSPTPDLVQETPEPPPHPRWAPSRPPGYPAHPDPAPACSPAGPNRRFPPTLISAGFVIGWMN